MAKGADIGSKRLISLAPDAWVQWLLNDPQAHVVDLLSADFQWVSRETDVLLRVRHPDLGDFLVLNEMQLRYRDEMPRRMRAYAALAEERYDLPVYPVLVNILRPQKRQAIPTRYRRKFLGVLAHQDYRVINLWEVEAGRILADELRPLLPFVPLMKGGRNERTLQRALTLLRADQDLSELEPLLAFFASFVLNTHFIRELMRWDMAILRESPWYLEIVSEGRRQEAFDRLLQILTLRFGSIPEDIRVILTNSTLEQLQGLFVPAINARSWNEFRASLPAQDTPPPPTTNPN